MSASESGAARVPTRAQGRSDKYIRTQISHAIPGEGSSGGRGRARTADFLGVNEALYQLSYAPEAGA
jgi:hypothetical protein